MYHKVRITVVSLIVMAVCVLSSVGTLSYFTDTDTKTNDFVVGNASTKLAIYKDTNGTILDTTTLDPLTDNMPDIAYYLQATNNGNIPVYQRFRVVIPIALSDVLTLKLDNCTLAADATDSNKSSCENTNYSVIYNKSVEVENTPTYAVYYIMSKSVLNVNASTSEWPTTAIEVGNISSVENLSELTSCENSDTNKCSFGVRVYSDAIQKTGFTGVADAFEEFAETYQ